MLPLSTSSSQSSIRSARNAVSFLTDSVDLTSRERSLCERVFIEEGNTITSIQQLRRSLWKLHIILPEEFEDDYRSQVEDCPIGFGEFIAVARIAKEYSQHNHIRLDGHELLDAFCLLGGSDNGLGSIDVAMLRNISAEFGISLHPALLEMDDKEQIDFRDFQEIVCGTQLEHSSLFSPQRSENIVATSLTPKNLRRSSHQRWKFINNVVHASHIWSGAPNQSSSFVHEETSVAVTPKSNTLEVALAEATQSRLQNIMTHHSVTLNTLLRQRRFSQVSQMARSPGYTPRPPQGSSTERHHRQYSMDSDSEDLIMEMPLVVQDKLRENNSKIKKPHSELESTRQTWINLPSSEEAATKTSDTTCVPVKTTRFIPQPPGGTTSKPNTRHVCSLPKLSPKGPTVNSTPSAIYRGTVKLPPCQNSTKNHDNVLDEVGPVHRFQPSEVLKRRLKLGENAKKMVRKWKVNQSAKLRNNAIFDFNEDDCPQTSLQVYCRGSP